MLRSRPLRGVCPRRNDGTHRLFDEQYIQPRPSQVWPQRLPCCSPSALRGEAWFLFTGEHLIATLRLLEQLIAMHQRCVSQRRQVLQRGVHRRIHQIQVQVLTDLLEVLSQPAREQQLEIEANVPP